MKEDSVYLELISDTIAKINKFVKDANEITFVDDETCLFNVTDTNWRIYWQNFTEAEKQT